MTDVASAYRNAERLVDLLVDEGPMTSAEIATTLGWPVGRVAAAIRTARSEVCPTLDLALPSNRALRRARHFRRTAVEQGDHNIQDNMRPAGRNVDQAYGGIRLPAAPDPGDRS